MKLHSLYMAFIWLAGSTAIGLAQSEFGKPFSGNKYTPRLSDIMGEAQSQHFKLWVAAKAQNWDLAAYEVQQLSTSLSEAAMLYNGLPVSNVTTLMTPLQSISDAITAKNARSFADNMRELTDGCNACHRSMGWSFVVIQVPTSQQIYGNQRFTPKGKQ
jgi:hypothetical protein